MDLYSYIYETDNESAQRIAKVVIDYPLSLQRSIQWLKKVVDVLGPSLD